MGKGFSAVPLATMSGECSGTLPLRQPGILFVSAGCDLRYYPWLKYRCSAPSVAVSKEVRLKYLPSDKITFEAVYNSSAINA